MSSFLIVVVIVSFQVLCDGAPGLLGFPLRRLHDYAPIKEYRVEKRTVDQYACLRAHNAKRALHADTSPLVWDTKLAQEAQQWADHLVNLGRMVHSSAPGEGENLYASWSTVKADATCADAVEAWYEEINYYDFNNPGFSSTTGHFTQVVWKGTTKVGAASATATQPDDEGFYASYVVARYSPPGNYEGQFANNVGEEL